jgi:hypothetical protein
MGRGFMTGDARQSHVDDKPVLQGTRETFQNNQLLRLFQRHFEVTRILLHVQYCDAWG